MILNRLIIDNFKIHKHLNLDLKNLTVLTGVNSSGKSSVIQALLLLRQNYLLRNLDKGLDLNGNLCRIGLGRDAICQSADTDDIRFELLVDGGQGAEWVFLDDNSSLQKSFVKLHYSACSLRTQELGLFSNNFHYISVARWDPRESYPLNTSIVEERHQFSIEKGQCELLPHYLYHYGKEVATIVPQELFCPGCQSVDFLTQVSAWESLISENVRVVPKLEGTAYTLNYAYHRQGDLVESPEYSAYNVGSGLSYVLPIIAALLSTPVGGLVVIENPEIHVHEQGQSRLASLIARAAQYGVQIIVETHSETILNGLLVASRRFEKSGVGVDKNNVAIYHFEKNMDSQTSQIHPVHIIGNGEIDVQPTAFFEQGRLDTNYLMGIEDAD